MSDSECCTAPIHLTDVLVASAAAKAVAAKRKTAKLKAHALPKVVLIYDQAVKVIIGAVLLAGCFDNSNAAHVDWNISRRVLLENPIALNKEDAKYISNIFELCGTIENQIRLSPVVCGGNLNRHYVDHIKSWKVFSLGPDAIDKIKRHSDEPFIITTKIAFSKALGIIPEKTNSCETTDAEYAALDFLENQMQNIDASDTQADLGQS
jgi:hypothetical protein